jgi:conjugal transfer ATP-binding protein TraC
MKQLIEKVGVPELVKKAKAWKRAKDQRPKKVSLHFGEQDAMDVLSYSAFEEHEDHIIIDGVYMRMMFISAFPFRGSSGWLDNLIHFGHDIDISMHIEEVHAHIALPLLNKKITHLESSVRKDEQTGRIIEPTLLDALESGQELRDKITRAQEKLFQLSINVCIYADSLTELNRLTKHLKNALMTRMFTITEAYVQQPEALQSIVPRGTDELGQKRNLDTSSLALCFPFISSEMVQPGGILYGINRSNNSLVILDRYSLHNANSIVFAQSGSGKSYTTKVEVLRQLSQGTQVIIIDPEREYQKLTESVGGTYVNLSSTSEQKINPFDVASTAHGEDQMKEHVQDLIEIIARMVGSPDEEDKTPALTLEERAVIDEVLAKMYSKKRKTAPSLREFYAEINKKGLLSLCKRLDTYLSGTREGIFNCPTNIRLDNRLVVFDIKDLPESLRQPMMMVISTYVQNIVKSQPRKRLLVIDEGWILLQNEESAKFVAGLVRRARKYYLGVSIISQQANDFLESKYGRAIASQSSLRILMKQDSTTIRNVVEQFALSEFEESFLQTCGKGDALIIADQNHATVRVVASAKEHPLITTDPLETIGS